MKSMNGIKMLGYRNAERFIRELMLIRRSLELLGIDAQEYDEKLQKWTEMYFEEFSKMSRDDLMLFMSATTEEPL